MLEALWHGGGSRAYPSTLPCGDGLWSSRTPQRYHPGEACMALKDYYFILGVPRTAALVQLNGNNFLFYNKSLGDLNVEKSCTNTLEALMG
jgi:hypothetical protein